MALGYNNFDVIVLYNDGLINNVTIRFDVNFDDVEEFYYSTASFPPQTKPFIIIGYGKACYFNGALHNDRGFSVAELSSVLDFYITSLEAYIKDSGRFFSVAEIPMHHWRNADASFEINQKDVEFYTMMSGRDKVYNEFALDNWEMKYNIPEPAEQMPT